MSDVMDRIAQMRVVDYEDKYEAQVLALARLMHAESISHRGIPLNEAKLIEQLKAGSTRPDSVYFRLVVRGDEVLGGFFGIISTNYFSNAKSARDLAWFIKPGKRGGFAAVMLVGDWEQWGRARGAVSFFLGQSTGVNIESTQRLYEKLGYRVVGVNTVKGV